MSEESNKSLLHTSHTLLDRVRDQNDEVAWKEFVSYYEQFIYNILRHIGVHESDAEELCQDIILKLWKKLPEFSYSRDRGKFRNWLGVVIRNEANRHFQKLSKSKKILVSKEQNEIEEEAEDKCDDEMDQIIADEWKEYVSNLAWKSIKERFKDNVQNVFLLYVKGKTTKEIAEECKITESSVRVYVKRIRSHLKDEIDRFNKELL